MGVLTLGVYTDATICDKDVPNQKLAYDKRKIKARVGEKRETIKKDKRIVEKQSKSLSRDVSSSIIGRAPLIQDYWVCFVWVCINIYSERQYHMCFSHFHTVYLVSSLSHKHVVIVFPCCVPHPR